MREVMDFTSLRRGDHCMAAVKTLRAIWPGLDRITGILSRFEFWYVYHHFVILDDVQSVDDDGVPRTASGDLVRIMEFTNTCREYIKGVWVDVEDRVLCWPAAAARKFMSKASCLNVALAEYGDMPCIFIQVARQASIQERDEIMERVHWLTENHRPYHMMFYNCEHAVNQVITGRPESPEVQVVLQDVALLLLRCGALASLAMRPGATAGGGAALVAYHIFGAGAIALRSLRRIWCANSSVWAHVRGGLLDRSEGWSLLLREMGRAVLAGGGAAAATAFCPGLLNSDAAAVWSWAPGPRHAGLALALCASASCGFDIIYSCICHAVLRLP
jgi:hypothetical protein